MPEINLHDLSQAKEPVPLIVNRYIKLAPEALDPPRNIAIKLPEELPELYVMNISEGNVQDPNSNVIGVFGFCDRRHYVWEDKFWKEFNITTPELINIIEYYKLHLQEELCDLDNIINKVGPAMDYTPKGIQLYINLYLELSKNGEMPASTCMSWPVLPTILKTPGYTKSGPEHDKIDSSIVTVLCQHHGFVVTRSAQEYNTGSSPSSFNA